MAFQFDPNQTPLDGAEAIVQLVTIMVAAGYSIHAYGDGTTRTSGGAGFDVTKLRGLSSAWVAVLEPSGGPATYVFQRSTDPPGNNAAWWIAYARQGLTADGTGTTVDSEFVVGDLKDVHATVGAPAALFPADDVSGILRCNVAADSTTRSWYLLGWNKGSGEARTALYCDNVLGHTSDTDTRVFYAHFRSSAPWVCDADHLTAYSSAPRAWYRYGLSGATWERCFVPYLATYDIGRVVPMSAGINPFDGSDDLLPPYYFHTRAGTRYFKGLSALTAYISAGRGTGHTFNPVNVSDDRVCCGHLAFPWPAGVAAVV